MNTLKTFYVICTYDDHRLPLAHAIETLARNADDATDRIKQLPRKLTVIGVVGGALASSESEALNIFYAGDTEALALTRKETYTVYGLLILAFTVLIACVVSIQQFAHS